MKKYYASLALAVVLILVVALPAIADALYSGTIRITNPGAVASDVTANFTLNSDSFIANGYATGNFSDVSIEYNGIPVKFMPGLGAGTSPWIIQVPLIGAGQNIDYTLLAKGATTGDIAYFPGTTGMTIADSTSMNITNQFHFLIENIYIDTTAGAGKYIIFKDGACSLMVSDTVTGNITFSIVGGASVSALNLPTAEYSTLEVTANTTHLMININSTLKGTAVMTANVTWNSNPWLFFSGNTTMYVKSIKLDK